MPVLKVSSCNINKEMKNIGIFFLCIAATLVGTVGARAQKYDNGLIDKSVAVVGEEMIKISAMEEEIKVMRANGMLSDKNVRCELLEQMIISKIFLMQARIDSLSVNNDMVESSLNARLDQVRTQLGGDDEVEKIFGKPVYKLRQEWRKSLQEQSLMQQMQQKVASDIPEMTPYDVKDFIASTAPDDLPLVPAQYRLSQICLYPDREAAAVEVKEKLLSIRARIMNGEKFSTLARIYSQDPGSARKGGELGMASKTIFWTEFSDAAMALKPHVVSQIVETPDGFHLIEVLEKKGDMFNARHILIKPEYTSEDRSKAFGTLDSLRNEINSGNLSFEMAARFFSQDPASRTNGGQMADPNTGSSYFEKDQLKPADYMAIAALKEGEISEPIESVDNEGRGNLVYKIIRVDKILPSHPASFEEDYDLMQNAAKEKLSKQAIDSFLEERIKSTYITIDPIFGDCEFEHKGLIGKVLR